jgi:acyl-CoA synthetase (AMP-forming)/AMP-acid ligase II
LGSALTDEDFGGAQGQAEFVRTLGLEVVQGGGGGSFLTTLLKELAEELSTLNMFDEVSRFLQVVYKNRNLNYGVLFTGGEQLPHDVLRRFAQSFGCIEWKPSYGYANPAAFHL